VLILALVMVSFFLLSGATLTTALIMTRRRRIELERRLRVAAGAPDLGAHHLNLWRPMHGPKLDRRLRSVFTAGHKHTWGMNSSGARLLVTALGAATPIFLVTAFGFGWSLWLSSLTATVAAFMLPRTLLLRQQKEAEQQFSELFPDAVVAI
jgi:Flp pilus assembly protein TadB